MATLTSSVSRAPAERPGNTTLAYIGLVLFILVYCARPNDWVPGMGAFPIGKVTAFLAVAGFALTLLQGKARLRNLPSEIRLCLLLFVQLCLAIPFSIWRRGSLELVLFDYGKVILITVVIATAVTSMGRLRRLIFVQTVVVGALAVLGVLGYGQKFHGNLAAGADVRLAGSVGGVFYNPNDLAFGVALVVPFAFVFLLRTRNPLRQAFWALVLLSMGYAVLLTYSRSGFLTLLAVLVVCLWRFGIRGRRLGLIALVGLAGLAVLLAGGPDRYGARLASIVQPAADPLGSAGARKALLVESLAITAKNPLLGVGPGNFPVVAGWHVTHNTYTELSSEAGIPALLLLLLLLRATHRSSRQVQKLAPENSEARLFAAAVEASLAGLVVGAFFASVAYHFFPYFLIGYSGALYQIASREWPAQQVNGSSEAGGKPRRVWATP